MTFDTDSIGTLTERFSALWSGITWADIPEAEIAGIKDHVLDTLSVALAGARTSEAASVIRVLTTANGRRAGATVWGTPDRLPLSQAALANGTSAHARDFDDGGGAGHAGSTVIPAALAVAESVGASGRDFLLATIAGYDVGYRSLLAVGGFAVHTGRGWHSSGTMGSLGAAAAAAKVLGLDAEKFANALGIAGSFTGGVWAFIDDGAMTKRLHPGKACETGVDAALLAQGGITGPHRIFESEFGGLFTTYNGGAGFREKALDGLGVNLNVASSYLKPYACCRGSHSTIDTVLRLMGNRGLRANNVKRFDIIAGQTAYDMINVYPIETVFDAQFSLPYAVSVTLVSGEAGLGQFEPPRLNEPEVRSVFDRITFTVDKSIGLEDGPRLHIELTDGTTIAISAGNPTLAKGSAVQPMTHAEVVAKTHALIDPIDLALADALILAVEGLDQASDVTTLLNALKVKG
ncbi:MmgE/PrpD family protein [Bradyrhizobium sp. SSUT18]|uniref:MmgE/PrpD family protein n=1 Tax=Bradyrhizobium sp. SSUT18 TaxID=3040602 RepID=UPI00244C1C5D|nr:MmgE/PrpD family protein [Bradyrhizobium sp. SSUT18]MDH2401813.1 MmgE/PrpD family protein [Bradyrhizobium sp. SSUT18]